MNHELRIVNEEEKENAVKILKNGSVCVMPTDTIYGIVASALNPQAVERIFEIKKRDKSKALIVLISRMEDLEIFGVNLDNQAKILLAKFWPGPVSVILPVSPRWSHINRGTDKVAFRLPSPEWLRNFIGKTGPIVAPSANPEGEKPAENIEEAKKYFGGEVDFYLDGGNLKSKPSSVVEIMNGEVKIIRK